MNDTNREKIIAKWKASGLLDDLTPAMETSPMLKAIKVSASGILNDSTPTNPDFVPYQESLELKELGFNQYSCLGNYADDEKHTLFTNGNRPGKTNAPTFSQAFRFFRKKHNLEYQIIKSANGNYSAVIHLNTQEYLDKISTLPHACLDEVVDCYSYEEAELACLRKLIEIVKNKLND